MCRFAHHHLGIVGVGVVRWFVYGGECRKSVFSDCHLRHKVLPTGLLCVTLRPGPERTFLTLRSGHLLFLGRPSFRRFTLGRPGPPTAPATE